jgi:adenosylcobinamide-phosphate synthase
MVKNVMLTPFLFALVYAADWLVGDPPWLPHPVRWIGRFIQFVENRLRSAATGPVAEFLAGAVLTILTVGVCFFGSWLVIGETVRRYPALGACIAVYFGLTTLATRNLIDEVIGVARRLEAADIPGARLRVGRIVGRDTGSLPEPEIIRASIETLAESASDGIVAPMFYLAVGGVPAALAYKSINTLDSMIGHNDSRYQYFGKFAARLDDVANFIPARITAALLVLAALAIGKNPMKAFLVWMRDGHRHASPNAGRPEAAMAGALDVRLGGTNYYDGEPHTGAFLGDAARPLDRAALADAVRLTTGVSLTMFGFALIFTFWSVR